MLEIQVASENHVIIGLGGRLTLKNEVGDPAGITPDTQHHISARALIIC